MGKILIVEDDAFLANAYSAKLLKAGHEFKVAKDGEEVFDILKNFDPDLIILDLIMPKKDGFTVLSELKQSPKWKSIPVVIASNLGQNEDIQKGLKLGAVDFIVKSNIRLSELVDKIAAILAKRVH